LESLRITTVFLNNFKALPPLGVLAVFPSERLDLVGHRAFQARTREALWRAIGAALDTVRSPSNTWCPLIREKPEATGFSRASVL